MALSLYINRLPGVRRIALMDDGRLLRYRLEQESEDPPPGALLVGRVTKVSAGIHAAFVDVGAGRNGFLDTRNSRLFAADNGTPTEVKAAKEGQALLVCLQRPAFRDKLATLSAEAKLVGLHCILLPFADGVRFSRDFRGDKVVARETLEALTHAGSAPVGWIVRGSAAQADPAWLGADGQTLLDQWATACLALRQASARTLFAEHPLMAAVRDGHKQGFRSIFCDDPEDFAFLRDQLARRDPALLPAVKLHDGSTPLFDTYRVEDALAHLEEPCVWLKSGGTLDIHQTEAMVTIDVNTARNTKDRGAQTAALRTNLEAAEEIGRQVRARNLAGLLVIDFVNARDAGWRGRVERALADAFADDEARTDILPMNKFGVVMMTRERIDLDLAHRQTEHCRRCAGQGRIKTCETLTLEIQRRLARQAPGMAGETLVVCAGTELAAHLRKVQDERLAPLAQAHGASLVVEQAPMPGRAYRIDIR